MSRRSSSRRNGAESHRLGEIPKGPGWWYPPTMVATADAALTVCREEVFGPVVVVLPFDDEADAVRMANDTRYGLSGSIWTRDSARALRMSSAVQAGVLSVNSNTSVRVGALRRDEAVGDRQRARPRGARVLLGAEERLLLVGMSVDRAEVRPVSGNVAGPRRPEVAKPERRVAVVTGASHGLGAGLAARFSDLGLRVGMCARKRPEPPSGIGSPSAS